MPFFPRNCFYLRISASSVLPLYVYLDNQHVDWMTDRVLQQVVADLRPKIIPKLRGESDTYMGSGSAPSNTKKGTVDVHRGDTYQFAYFLREAEPHSVLVKTRNFVVDTSKPPTASPKDVAEPQGSRQKKGASKKSGRTATKKGKSRRKSTAREHDEDDYGTPSQSSSEQSASDNETRRQGTTSARRSKRARKTTQGIHLESDETGDVAMEEGPRVSPPATAGADIVVKEEDGAQQSAPASGSTTFIEINDDDEPKPKLALQLKYQGFSIFGRCLCVVVEPWPPQRSGTRAPSLAPSTAARQHSIAPPEFVPSGGAGQRAKTPLFLPDFDDEPTDFGPSRLRTLPPVPLFHDSPPAGNGHDSADDSGDDGALMQFSQMLTSAGRMSGAGVEEDDEFDGTALFADADEAKEL
ncbi:hypothetical protein BC834DRAFT_864789 [Gloeopeniophorella convolvens]|nr:hypothetical protein BC834DRAFT_864789 [Gloeopeniophorella convolvens]